MSIVLYITIVLTLVYSILILFFRYGWIACKEIKNETKIEIKKAVSILVPVRNEEKNIENLLKCLLNQNYPQQFTEIIIIDDFSTDKTLDIIKRFPTIKIIELHKIVQQTKINAYKKRAIEEGIKQATGELIITTDADCTMHNDWLTTLVNYYNETHASMIAAPVSYLTSTHWLSIFQSIDFFTMQGITASILYTKKGTMCNGANLAYTKKVFNEVEGFKNIDDIASGDDMLLMYKISTNKNNKIEYVKSKNAIVYTQAMPTIYDFLQQRIRWASKAKKMKDKRVVSILFIVLMYNFCLFLLFINSFFSIHNLMVFVCFLLIKIVVEIYFLFPVAKFFNKVNELKWFPLFQFIHIPYVLIAGLWGSISTYTWKGRRVK